MPYRTLADFLEDLGRAGELAAVDAEVDPCLEIAEITRRTARRDGPALLFRNVKGHEIPLLTNLFGSEARILRALGAESLEEATARIDRALNSGGGDGWLGRLRFGTKSGAAASYGPNRVKSAACQQIVRLGSDINLQELPLLRWDKQTLLPAIQSVVILSADPETHAQVFLRGDLQITGRDAAVIAWSERADSSRLAAAYRKLGMKMPVAIVLGGDPVVQLSAAAPLPSFVDPLGLAGLLREKPIDAVACRTVDLIVPAESDFVIEGVLDPAEDGKLVDSWASPHGRIIPGLAAGFTIRLSAITHRANRVLPAIVPAVGSNECSIRDRLLARVFLPYFKLQLPELTDFDLPLAGGTRHIAFVAIDKSYLDQARQAATIIWSMKPFQFIKLLIIVNDDVDVRDADRVLSAVAQEMQVGNDVWQMQAPFDPYDPAAPWGGFSRIAIDATHKGRAEEKRHYLTMTAEAQNLVTERWAEYGLGPESVP